MTPNERPPIWLRPRHRAEAQAGPERDPQPLPRFALPRRACRATATRLRPRLENRRALFREANIPRETQLAELEQQYQKTIGAMTVTFQGQERTLAQMAPFLEETDRAVRQAAGSSPPRRRLQDRDTLDDLFDQMLALRIEVAHEAGFASFVDFAFRQRERFDYGVGRRPQFHEAVEKVVVPLAAADPGAAPASARGRRSSALGHWRSIRWAGRRSQPFQRRRASSPREPRPSSARSTRSSGQQFAFLRDHGLLDLANRKGKAPGGYQTTFEDGRLPFIFMNAVGLDGDVRTLLHEGGHAFHTLASRGEPLSAYRESPIEFCEVASMTMELLGAQRPRPVLQQGRRRPVQPQAARGNRADPALDRHGRRLPALDL